MVTQKDVAKKAGVSSATVSAVVNKNKFVSEDLKKKVIKNIKELNYEPNIIAKSLKIRKTFTIGIVIPNIESPTFAFAVKSIEEIMRRNNYNVILNNSDEDWEKEKEILRNLREKRVDGIIIAPCGNENIEIFNLYKKYLKILFIDRDIEKLNIDFVGSDNFESTFSAVSYLCELGHKEIGIISLPSRITSGFNRLNGYLSAIKKYNLIERKEFIKEGFFTKQEGYMKTNEILASRIKPNAIIVCNHLMMLGCLKSLKENSLDVPNDISVIGYDDLPWIDFFSTPITVVSQKWNEISEKAAELIINRLKNGKDDFKELKVKKILIKTDLIVRSSCKVRD